MRGAKLKIKKSWRGAGGEGAAPPPQCILWWTVVVVVVVVLVVVVVVGGGGGGGGGGGFWRRLQRCKLKISKKLEGGWGGGGEKLLCIQSGTPVYLWLFLPTSIRQD